MSSSKVIEASYSSLRVVLNSIERFQDAINFNNDKSLLILLIESFLEFDILFQTFIIIFRKSVDNFNQISLLNTYIL